MAIKTFTSTTLSASDINTYLNNGGLVYITEATVTGAGTSINNCFSSTYDNYVLVMDNALGAAVTTIYLKMRVGGVDSSAAYYLGGGFTPYTGAGGVLQQNNVTPGWFFNTIGPNFYTSTVLDIQNPAQAIYTTFTGRQVSNAGDTWWTGGVHASASAYDGFSIVSASSFTFKISVYGRRKA